MTTSEILSSLRRFDGYLPLEEIEERLGALDHAQRKAKHSARRARARTVIASVAVVVAVVQGVVTIQLAAELAVHRAALASWQSSCLTPNRANDILDVATRVANANAECIAQHVSNRTLFDTIYSEHKD